MDAPIEPLIDDLLVLLNEEVKQPHPDLKKISDYFTKTLYYSRTKMKQASDSEIHEMFFGDNLYKVELYARNYNLNIKWVPYRYMVLFEIKLKHLGQTSKFFWEFYQGLVDSAARYKSAQAVVQSHPTSNPEGTK